MKRLRIFDGAALGVDGATGLADYLRAQAAWLEVVTEGDFLSRCIGSPREEVDTGEMKLSVATRLAGARLVGPDRSGGRRVTPGEIDYELRMLDRTPPRPFGVVYEGLELLNIFTDLLGASSFPFEEPAIAITDQLFATAEGADRYHLRVAVFGHPCIVSTTGLVEAPARPREFYLRKRLGIEAGPQDRGGRGESLEHGDPRIVEVLKGYVYQALFYYLTGDPFCGDPSCRLFNAHWQEELLAAQFSPGPGLCARHRLVLGGPTHEEGVD